MNPPSYHFTRSQGMAPPTVVDESDHTSLGRAGRLAPKWIEDLLDGKLRDERSSYLDVGCANAVPQSEFANDRDGSAPLNPRHELLAIGHQTVQGHEFRDEEGKSGRQDIWSCVCQNCRYHFVFTIVTPTGSDTCGLNNYQDLFHHLVFIQSSPLHTVGNPKYYPVIGQLTYECSASRCGLRVVVEVSEPRLKERFFGFLQDDDRIVRRLLDAQETEPDRFPDSANLQPGALKLLWIYVRNIVEGDVWVDKPDGTKSARKIDKRNKRFYIQFGDDEDCTELFRFLEFEEINVNDSSMWEVPTPDIIRPTTIGSRLAFFQDIKSEIETLIQKDNSDLRPISAIGHLKKALHLDEHIATTKVSSAKFAAEDFDTLGITPDLHESIFWYAFSCQRQTDQANEPAYFAALQRLAQGRGNEELELKVQSYDSMRTAPPPPQREDDDFRRATEMSLRDAQPGPVQDIAGAYAYFDFNQPPETQDVVVGKFVAMCDSSPAQRSRHREKLLVIARATNNKNLIDLALDSVNLDEAIKYLEVEKDTDPDFICETAKWHAQDGKKDYLLVALALQVIGKSRTNNSGLIETGAIIKAEHELSYNTGPSGLTSVNAQIDNGPVNMALPTGLENIRNTCYLNSILQYLFTVRPLRETVLNWEKYGLENTDEQLATRHIDPGASHVEKGEAFAGQQLAIQLRSLFTELENSQQRSEKPTQSLALAALKNAKQLERDGAAILAGPTTKTSPDSSNNKDQPAPPPLPARPSPAPPVPPRSSQEPKVTVNAVPDLENAETSSTVSAQTLVNQVEEGGSDHGYVTVTRPDSSTGGHTVTPPETPGEQSKQQLGDASMTDAATGDAVASQNASSNVRDASGDVSMVDSTNMPEATVEEKIARALNDSSVTGTDQQDVEEVMGNIISHLRASIKSTGFDDLTKTQTDPITDLFFWTSASYSRMNGETEYRQIERTSSRWVTAFPDENGAVISLLQALDRSFQREFIQESENKHTRFSSIVKLPPILHIHIQRTTRGGGKNSTAIEIPEVLYLDRFMDTSVDSALFKKRDRSWNLLERLRSFNGPDGEAKKPKPDDVDHDTLMEYDRQVVEEYMRANNSAPEDDPTIISDDIRGLLEQEGIPIDYPPPRTETSKISREAILAAVNPEAAAASRKRKKDNEEACRKELATLFDELTEQKYRLHAVICHAGQSGRSGHYWVWIYDFEKTIWRKYNDSTVTEVSDSAKVIEELSTHGEPYYLAYVRETDIDELVNVPVRNKVPSPAAAEMTPPDEKALGN